MFAYVVHSDDIDGNVSILLSDVLLLLTAFKTGKNGALEGTKKDRENGLKHHQRPLYQLTILVFQAPLKQPFGVVELANWLILFARELFPLTSILMVNVVRNGPTKHLHKSCS